VDKIENEYDTSGATILKFDLMEEFSIETALVVCEIYQYNNVWKFNAVASGYQGGLAALCRGYGLMPN
jgi:tellurium resistance protein TerD